MPNQPDSLPVHLPPEVLADFRVLGAGDPHRGALVAIEAARLISNTTDDSPIDAEAPTLRLLLAATQLTDAAQVVTRHIERYESERRAFLDDVARLGRIGEDKPI